MKLFLYLLIFIFCYFNGNTQSTLEVFNRKTYLDIRAEVADIPVLVKKYNSSELPIHLDFSPDTNLREEHFIELAKLPLTFMRFSMWEKKFYCKGLDLLQSLDSLELTGYSHQFLNDASNLKELKFLQLEIFIPDSGILTRPSFDQIVKLRITLSRVDDISDLFGSLNGLTFLDISKNDAILNLSSSMKVLKTAPINKLGFGLCSIDTTNFKNVVFPILKKVWLIGVSAGKREFGFIQFIHQNISLEFVDITMNGLSEKFAADLREKFPYITIKRDY